LKAHGLSRGLLVAMLCLLPISTATAERISPRTAWKLKPSLLDASSGRVTQEELVKASALIKDQLSRSSRSSFMAGKQLVPRSSGIAAAVQGGRGQTFQLPGTTGAAAGWDITWNESNGTPVFISTPTTGTIAGKALANGLPGDAPQHTALELINEHRELFRLDNPMDELTVTATITDRFGKQHIKFQQRYRGLPLWNQEIVAHVAPSGGVYAINGRYVPTPRGLAVVDAITAAAAIDVALTELGARSLISELSPQSKALLHYDGPQVNQCIWIHPVTQRPHLVWHVELRPNFRDRWYYFIDAHSAQILQRYNATATDGPVTSQATDLLGVVQTVHGYEVLGEIYMIDASRPMFQTVQSNILNGPLGAIWTLDAQGTDLGRGNDLYHVSTADNVWTDATAVSAHTNTARVFEYFLNTHGRLGIDGLGGTMISIIHVTDDNQPLDNAFWNGFAMAYGDGNVVFSPLAGAHDVAGHEMTHGVIERTVNLEYAFEAGALNESFADVFGTMVDREDWQIGEDLTDTRFFSTGALRDLSNPNNGGNMGDNGWQPAHMDEFVELDIDSDNGGVHVNSGIPNRAAFLIADQIGREKTEQIYYRILDARYLNSRANFIDMRLAARRAAGELFGDPSAELDAVGSAFDAVGIEGIEGLQAPEDIAPLEGTQRIAFVNSADGNTLYLSTPSASGEDAMVKLSDTEVSTITGNPVAVSRDGRLVFFVDADFNLRLVVTEDGREVIVSNTGTWRSVALSPDGRKLATTTIFADTTIFLLDLVDPEATKAIRLTGSTTQDGLEANVVVFADAMSWDPNGDFLIYDALNRIPQSNAEPIEYWDVNILNVAEEVIVPLFPPQARGLQLGNPSFANTNESFIVFDFLDADNGFNQIIVFDLFTGEGTVLESGDILGFPRFSPADDELIFERIDAETDAVSLARIPLAAGRLERSGETQTFRLNAESARWFVIGEDEPPTDVDEIDTESLPTSLSLQQNYPNPFNSNTVIRYDLAAEGDVSLVIYDLVGRRVASVASGRRHAGTHSVSWDGLNQQGDAVASGVYLYELVTTAPDGASQAREARKLVLLR